MSIRKSFDTPTTTTTRAMLWRDYLQHMTDSDKPRFPDASERAATPIQPTNLRNGQFRSPTSHREEQSGERGGAVAADVAVKEVLEGRGAPRLEEFDRDGHPGWDVELGRERDLAEDGERRIFQCVHHADVVQGSKLQVRERRVEDALEELGTRRFQGRVNEHQR